MMPLDCETCLLRQFDSDAAPGLPTPPDVAAHLAGCESCRREWQLRDVVDSQLRNALMAEVPTELYRRAYHTAIIAPQEEPKPIQQHFRLLFAGLVGIGCGVATLAVPYLSQWPWLAPIALVSGAVLTYLFEFTNEAKTPAL